MAHGVHHAKLAVVKRADDLAKKLQNGSAEDQQTQGEAVGLLVEMITPLYVANLVTTEECAEIRQKRDKRCVSHLEEMKTIVGSMKPADDPVSTMTIGKFKLTGKFVPYAFVLLIILFPYIVNTIRMIKDFKGW